MLALRLLCFRCVDIAKRLTDVRREFGIEPLSGAKTQPSRSAAVLMDQTAESVSSSDELRQSFRYRWNCRGIRTWCS